MSREIDRAVAEKVMGWDDVRFHICNVPPYTGSAEHAHAVIARMGELGWWCDIESPRPVVGPFRNVWAVAFGTMASGSADIVTADPFPLAVCKAALAALEGAK